MRKIVSIMIMVLLGATSCKKNEQGYRTNLRTVQTLFEEQKYDEAIAYMTEGTKKSLRRLSTTYPGIAEAGYGLAILFRKGVEWVVIEDTMRDDVARIKVKYARHPVENIKGSEAEFVFKKESGEWRLDMEREIEAFIEEMNEAEKARR
jgi:hypothetical protein